MTEQKRIETPWDLKECPLLTADVRNAFISGAYAFTPESKDGEELPECEARFVLVKAQSSIPSASLNALAWNVLAAFEEDCGEFGVTVYRNEDDPADYILEMLTTIGGPTVRVRYQSASKMLTVTGYHGSDLLELKADWSDFEDTPLAEFIDWYATAR